MVFITVEFAKYKERLFCQNVCLNFEADQSTLKLLKLITEILSLSDPPELPGPPLQELLKLNKTNFRTAIKLN